MELLRAVFWPLKALRGSRNAGGRTTEGTQHAQRVGGVVIATGDPKSQENPNEISATALKFEISDFSAWPWGTNKENLLKDQPREFCSPHGKSEPEAIALRNLLVRDFYGKDSNEMSIFLWNTYGCAAIRSKKTAGCYKATGSENSIRNQKPRARTT